jgi:hypothetical protein
LPAATPSSKLLLSVWGILLFIAGYILAASLYPGGNDMDKTATGFSWQHNYWCELMATKAQNGMSNTARPVAIAALAVLSLSIILFWYYIPRLFISLNTSSLFIRYCGIGSMLIAPLLLTGIHDPVINLAALLGGIAITLLVIKLFRYQMYGLFWQGIGCLLLCGINNYVYYSKDLLHYLPVIQKITFLFFLCWFIQLALKQYRHTKENALISPVK